MGLHAQHDPDYNWSFGIILLGVTHVNILSCFQKPGCYTLTHQDTLVSKELIHISDYSETVRNSCINDHLPTETNHKVSHLNPDQNLRNTSDWDTYVHSDGITYLTVH